MLISAVIVYLILTILIGLWASKRVKTAGDFINAGRNLHPAINTAALFALWFGSETIFGASSEFYNHGLRGIIEDPLGGVLCLMLVAFFFAKKLYRLNILTIGDLFKLKYGEKIELLSSILIVVSFVGYAAAQIVALGLLSQVLIGINMETGMIISAMIVMLYTFSGGMWAVSITDFIQSVIIVLGLFVMTIMVTIKVGGVDIVFNSIREEQKLFLPQRTSTDIINWGAAWMVLGLGSIASQDIFQRINSARSEKAAYYSTLLGGVLYLFLALIPLYLIQAGHLIDSQISKGDSQLSLLRLVYTHMPQWVQILFFGSLLSAIMSTCSGALLAPASILSENILKPILKTSGNDKKLLLLTRLSVLLVSIAALFLAISNQNILSLVAESSVIGLVTIFVPFVAALHFNHTNRTGAFLSILIGTVVYVVFRFIPLSDIHPSIFGLGGALLGIVLGSFTRPKV